MPLLIIIFFNDVAVDMQIWAFWQEVDVESLILRWQLRPVDLLFYLLINIIV